jgi:hypothetical protein
MSLPDQMPQIQILLNEYNALRAEITNRTANGFQLVGIGFAILALLLSQIKIESGKLWTIPKFWSKPTGIMPPKTINIT